MPPVKSDELVLYQPAVFSNITLDRLSQSRKVKQVILFTLLPIVTVFKFVQLRNIAYPITPQFIVAVSKLIQFTKKTSPILVTLLGIEIEVKLEQLLKADRPILVTLFGIVIDVKLE